MRLYNSKTADGNEKSKSPRKNTEGFEHIPGDVDDFIFFFAEEKTHSEK